MLISLLLSFSVYITSLINPINNHTASEIMFRLPILFTPASYVLLIWVLIYIVLCGWIYHFWRTQSNHSQSVLTIRSILFCCTTILIIVMIYSWHYELFYLELVALLIVLLLTAGLYFTYPKRENHIWDRVPISLLLGCGILSMIELTNYLLRLHEWGGWGLSHSLWTVIFLTFATAIALHFMYHHRDIAFNAVFIWFFVGIAVKNGWDELFVTTAALFLSAVISASFYFLKPTGN